MLLVVGPGGVGKTTMAAALAARAAARHGRRVLVATVDPARRLAQALGTPALAVDPVLVPLPDGDGRLWVQMVDMSAGWDGLVERLSTSDADRDALLANPLYRALTTQFVQSHDYVALDRLRDSSADGRYDLVVIDTPPSAHAVDILDAPERLLQFFDSRLLRWLTAPYRSRLVQVTARPFLAVAERLLGGAFLARIGEFFWLLSKLQPGLVTTSAEITARLRDPATGYVVVTSGERQSAAQADRLVAELARRSHRLSLLVCNRLVPDVGPVGAGDLDEVVDPSLREAVAAVVDERRRVDEVLDGLTAGAGAPVVRVPWLTHEPGSVVDLVELLDR